MPKKSSGGKPPVGVALAPTPASTAPARLKELIGFDPTPGQQDARARFWALARSTPTMIPTQMGLSEIQRLLRVPQLETWWKDPDFRYWFLDGQEWRSKVELLLDLALSRAIEAVRDPMLHAKDLINLLKLAAEIGDILPKKWVKERFLDAEIAGKTPEELEQLVLDVARARGWAPPPEGGRAPPAELPPVLADNDEETDP